MTSDDRLMVCRHPISTHTLTWSVTDGRLIYDEYPAISTHTLTWSVTCPQYTYPQQMHFNSHAHVERDRLIMLIKTFINVFQLTRSRGA